LPAVTCLKSLPPASRTATEITATFEAAEAMAMPAVAARLAGGDLLEIATASKPHQYKWGSWNFCHLSAFLRKSLRKSRF